jgi:hypothetical protein
MDESSQTGGMYLDWLYEFNVSGRAREAEISMLLVIEPKIVPEAIRYARLN